MLRTIRKLASTGVSNRGACLPIIRNIGGVRHCFELRVRFPGELFSRCARAHTVQWFMKSIKLSLTLDELKGLLQTVQNQLFHVKYLDPRIPGYKAQAGELKAAEAAVRVLEEAIKQDRRRTPGPWESPVRFGHPTPAK